MNIFNIKRKHAKPVFYIISKNMNIFYFTEFCKSELEADKAIKNDAAKRSPSWFASTVFGGALAPPAAGMVGAARPFPSDIIWSARSCRASFSAFARSPNFNSFNTQPLACKSTQSVCHVLHSEIARGYQIIVAFWWAVTASPCVRTNVSKFLRSRTHGRGIYNTQKGI